MNEKVSLITGANSGIGLALTKKILTEQGKVIALIRSSFPTDDPVLTQAIAHGRLTIYQANLSDFASLKAALTAIKQHNPALDVIFNNAGVSTATLEFSPQGRELQFEVNTVVPYILLMELKECLSANGSRTVINTSSNAALYVKKFRAEELDRPNHFKKLFGPYAASKLALTLWTREVASWLSTEGIRIASVDPGGNQSKMTASTSMPLVLRLVAKFMFSPASTGAQRLQDAARQLSDAETGAFFIKGKPASYRFQEQGNALLSKLHAIYRQEYL
ncbi:SDR family NAD(P)-dependent oxidoreductase [Cytophagaceae bacterium YF14B1]|uniref:SDR family NAD(P)-dependent oxidoreductase n=1 Tax=Xanthocytophaga flava TaxID=3048013 RepID=A0AAE3UDY7_9BACT|nr:SDR family NAD(P)-dependent oxidoreductase [Xanthocytophaga flavus]MDJ1486244.1 SDR family NAD(P)-dependent oxidoreductase [Xanthocytophaga flavus]